MSKEKIKVLFYGDSPSVSTGFGTVSRNILVPLHETGRFDITVLGVNYWGQPHEFPFPIWPVGMNEQKDPYGRQMVQERIPASDFDILFMIQDSFILEFAKDLLPQLRVSKPNTRSIVYFPIDGVPKPSWIEAMAASDYPVTYTDFGKEECVKAFPGIGDRLRVIPHGANVDDFYPINYGEMLDFRKNFFGPLADKFIVTMVNRNQQRKDIPRFLLAFKEFKKECPDSICYLHMAIRDMGWNLDEVVKSVGLQLNKDVVFPTNFSPNQGFPIDILNRVINASDVVVSSTLGEGWGLSQVESMATKTPIISPDNTACTEIVNKSGGGLLVKSGETIEHFIVLPNDNEVCRPIITVSDMVEKLKTLYNDEVLRMRLGENGYKYIHENWIWDKHIVPQWLGVFEAALKDIESNEDECCFSGALEV